MSSPAPSSPRVRSVSNMFGGGGVLKTELGLARRGSIVKLTFGDLEVGKKESKVVGNYLLGEVLGKGAYGKVKQGVDVRTGRRVAVKSINIRLLKAKAGGVFGLSKINKEITAMSMCRGHPNVIQYIECVNVPEKDKRYIVMEHLMGGTMEQRLKLFPGNRIPETLAKVFFHQLLDAVAFMHGKGIIHRDIKPGNIMFGANDVIKLTDFGVAEVASLYEREPLLESFAGSAAFQPPEVSEEDGCVFSGFAADRWALGVTLYMAVVGAMPFRGENLNSLLNDIRTSPLQLPDWISSRLAHLLAWMLDKDPARRPGLEEIAHHPWFRDDIAVSDVSQTMASTFPLRSPERPVAIHSALNFSIASPSPTRPEPMRGGGGPRITPERGEKMSPPDSSILSDSNHVLSSSLPSPGLRNRAATATPSMTFGSPRPSSPAVGSRSRDEHGREKTNKAMLAGLLEAIKTYQKGKAKEAAASSPAVNPAASSPSSHLHMQQQSQLQQSALSFGHRGSEAESDDDGGGSPLARTSPSMRRVESETLASSSIPANQQDEQQHQLPSSITRVTSTSVLLRAAVSSSRRERSMSFQEESLISAASSREASPALSSALNRDAVTPQKTKKEEKCVVG